ncbi:hypothetical protein [Kitasatospora albolonga]
MSAVRRALAVLAVTALVSLGFTGTSYADQCEWPWDGGFYCQKY